MVQAEAMKAQTKAQVDLQRAQMDDARKREEMAMQDDLKKRSDGSTCMLMQLRR